MVKDLPRIDSLFIDQTQFGGDLTSRKDRLGGTFMEIGSLTAKHEINLMGQNYKEFEWSKTPIYGQIYDIYIETAMPISIMNDFEEVPHSEQPVQLENIGRLEAMMEWWLTYNELQRMCGRMESMIQTEFHKNLQELIDNEQPKIHELLVGYHDRLEEYGDYSLEQYKRYAKAHNHASSPFEEEFVSNRRIPWAKIEKDEVLLQETWGKMIPKVHEWNSGYDKFCKKNKFKAMVRGDVTYEAGRNRMAEYEVVFLKDKAINAKGEAYFHRTADGVPILSQSEIGVYGRKDLKTKVYQDIYHWIARLLGITDSANYLPIRTKGMEFYKALNEGDWTCLDLRNAEKSIGVLMWFVPYAGDMLVRGYSREVARKFLSGTGPTALCNDILKALALRSLKDEYGLEFSKIAAGGDNSALQNSNIEEILNHIEQKTIGLEPRVLGYCPKLKRFWPVHLTTDNPKHGRNLRHNWKKITQTQSIQYELRPLQSVVQNNLMKTNSAVEFINWAIENKLDEEAEILNRNYFLEIIEQRGLKENFADKFSKELNWLKSFIPTHTNPTYSTNLIVNAR